MVVEVVWSLFEDGCTLLKTLYLNPKISLFNFIVVLFSETMGVKNGATMVHIGAPDIHLDRLFSTLSQLTDNDNYLDVVIHCKGKTSLKTSQILLASASTMLRDMFRSSSDSVECDLLCTDFNREAMEKILDLISIGKVNISGDVMYQEMLTILRSFGMILSLEIYPREDDDVVIISEEDIRKDIEELLPELIDLEEVDDEDVAKVPMIIDIPEVPVTPKPKSHRKRRHSKSRSSEKENPKKRSRNDCNSLTGDTSSRDRELASEASGSSGSNSQSPDQMKPLKVSSHLNLPKQSHKVKSKKLRKSSDNNDKSPEIINITDLHASEDEMNQSGDQNVEVLSETVPSFKEKKKRKRSHSKSEEKETSRIMTDKNLEENIGTNLVENTEKNSVENIAKNVVEIIDKNQAGTSDMNKVGTSDKNQAGTSDMSQAGSSNKNQTGTSGKYQEAYSRKNQAVASDKIPIVNPDTIPAAYLVLPPPHICGHCDRVFLKKSALCRHVETHLSQSGANKYNANLKSSSKDVNEDDLVTGDNDEDDEIEILNKPQALPASSSNVVIPLQATLRSNKKAPQVLFKCRLCDFKYAQYSGLMVHMAHRHYREELKAKFGTNKKNCIVCEKTFKSSHNLLLHQMSRHMENVLPPKNFYKNSK